MTTILSDELNNLKIGVVGCGHLGQALVELFLTHGWSKDALYLSYHGNPATYQQLKEKGWADCISDNDQLVREADLIFVTVRPVDMVDLMALPIPQKTVVVSCAAGATGKTLEAIFNRKVSRMMVSGPDTLLAGKGVAALYPNEPLVGSLLKKLGLAFVQITSESDINVLTAGVCLPGILLACSDEGEIKSAIAEMAQDYPWFSGLYVWAKEVLPVNLSKTEQQAYLAKMITTGGVTEAIMTSLKSGDDLLRALRHGIKRSQAIAEEVNQLLTVRRQM
ncbi:MAG: NAD(P)-binding domain-containing protein [Sporolactobacillus sp.]